MEELVSKLKPAANNRTIQKTSGFVKGKVDIDEER